MITYNEIYDLLRKEKYSEPLQELPKNFFNELAAYLNEKKSIISKEHDMFSEAIMKTKKQMENTLTVVKELILRRKKKILNLAFVAAETGISKRDFENMMAHEKELFETVARKLEDNDKKINEFINGKAGREIKNKLIMFKSEVESFVDAEGNALGPYKKGDIANLPSEIVNILIEGDKAVMM